MTEHTTAEPDNTAVRVALWRALHVQLDPPPHVFEDEIGLQLAAPEHLRARAASLYFFGFMGGAPLGGLIAGSLTAHGGTRLR